MDFNNWWKYNKRQLVQMLRDENFELDRQLKACFEECWRESRRLSVGETVNRIQDAIRTILTSDEFKAKVGKGFLSLSDLFEEGGYKPKFFDNRRHKKDESKTGEIK